MKLLVSIALILSWTVSQAQHDHGGHNHDHGGHSHGAPVETNKTTYQSAHGSTSKYEYVVHYDNIEVGKETLLTLYISDFETNKPVSDAKFTIEDAKEGTAFHSHPLAEGSYEVHASFKSENDNSIRIKLLFPTIDEVLIEGVSKGKTKKTEEESESSGMPIWLTILFVALAFTIGMIGAVWYNKKQNS